MRTAWVMKQNSSRRPKPPRIWLWTVTAFGDRPVTSGAVARAHAKLRGSSRVSLQTEAASRKRLASLLPNVAAGRYSCSLPFPD